MRESTKEFPWANIWMMAFSAAGVWLVYPRGEHPYWHDTMQSVIPLAIVFLIAFVKIPVSLYHEGGDRRLTLNDMGRLYLDALKLVFRRKWIPWLFGSLLALTLIAMFADLALQSPRPADPYPMPTERPDFMVTFSRSVHTAITSAPNHFLPSFGIARGAWDITIFALALIVFVIYLAVYSKRLADDPEYSRQAEFLRFLAAPIVIILAAVAVATPIAWERFLAEVAQGRTGSLETSSQVILSLATRIGGGLVALLLAASVVGAVLGSLLRAKRGETVTWDTFVRSAIRYFRPMVGLYLLLIVASIIVFEPMMALVNISPVLANVLFSVQWLTLLLMLMPSAVVLRETGALQGIRSGLGDWISNVGVVLPFVALGITFISVSRILCEIPTNLLRSHPGESTLRSVLVYLSFAADRAISLVITAVMMVAVWEFYQRVVPAEQSPRP